MAETMLTNKNANMYSMRSRVRQQQTLLSALRSPPVWLPKIYLINIVGKWKCAT